MRGVALPSNRDDLQRLWRRLPTTRVAVRGGRDFPIAKVRWVFSHHGRVLSRVGGAASVYLTYITVF
jgi:hypothetical protein